MALYTFILQYDGGTYVSQVVEQNNLDAMRKWLRELDVSEIPGFTEVDKQLLIKDDFSDETPIQLKDCINIWCFGLRTNKELALVNFVLTQI